MAWDDPEALAALARACDLEDRSPRPWPSGWGRWQPTGTAQLDDGELVQLIPIPQEWDREFFEFCWHHDIVPLGSERRGWWGGGSTYLRDATHLAYRKGQPITVWGGCQP